MRALNAALWLFEIARIDKRTYPGKRINRVVTIPTLSPVAFDHSNESNSVIPGRSHVKLGSLRNIAGKTCHSSTPSKKEHGGTETWL